MLRPQTHQASRPSSRAADGLRQADEDSTARTFKNLPSLAILLAVTWAVPMTSRGAESDAEKKPANSIRVRVLGPDGKPIKDAAIHVSVWSDDKQFKANQDFITDSAGETTAPLPGHIRILRIWARKENHVPLFAQWWPEMQPDGNEIPKDLTLRLPAGTTIGGTVTDEDGIPIQGAHVEVKRATPGMREELAKHINLGTWLAEGDAAVITDQQGRWQLGNVPSGEDTVVRLKLSHPGFINDAVWGQMQADQGVTMPLLRDRTAVIKMSRGVVLQGRVTDPDGKAVPNAVVVWGDDPYLQTGSQEVRTGSDGSFKTSPLDHGETSLTLMAEGWAPQRKQIVIGPDTQPIDFHVHRGKTIEFHFEDFDGTPVAGVFVGISQWQGAKSLYNHKHPNVLDTKIPRTSDKHGNFVWDWAPEDPVTYTFGKRGYAPQRNQQWIADDELIVILMRPVLTIRGVVSDAVTGKAIEAFKVAVRPADRADVARLEEQGSQFSKMGSYRIEVDPQPQPFVICVEAKGYQSFTSPPQNEGTGEIEYDAELTQLP